MSEFLKLSFFVWQQDEVEALASIFGTDFWTEDKESHVYCMRLYDDGDNTKYTVTLEVCTYFILRS